MIRKSFQIAVLVVLAPLGMYGQATGLGGPTPFGNGEQPRLNYAGEASPQNILLITLNGETAYDGNVFNTANARFRDITFLFGPRFVFLRSGKHLTFSLDYQPYLELYRKAGKRDRLDHALVLDANYQVSPRFALRLRDTFLDQSGIFQLRSSQEFIPALGSPTSLNGTVLPAFVPTRLNEVRGDAVYQKSGRSSFDLFGGFVDRRFREKMTQQRPLFNVKGVNAGLEYAYRLNQTNTLGALYLLQNLSFGQGGAHMIVHGFLFTFARQLSPTVTLNFFGGPQYTRLHDNFTFELPFLFGQIIISGRVLRTMWQPAVGGSFTKQSKKTVFQIYGQTLVNDGFGYARAATVSSGELRLSRRLGGWDAIWSLGYARTSALGVGLFESSLQSQTAGFALEHSLKERLTARLAYEYLRQHVSGQIPLPADLHRNRVSFGVFYQMRRIPLGR